jgi:hypothetical protein
MDAVAQPVDFVTHDLSSLRKTAGQFESFAARKRQELTYSPASPKTKKPT